MEKFIPKEKLSKKKQRELNSKLRTTWNISPVTRRSDPPKAYNRRKAQDWKRDGFDSALNIFSKNSLTAYADT